VRNTVAYYKTELITAVKSFIVQASGFQFFVIGLGRNEINLLLEQKLPKSAKNTKNQQNITKNNSQNIFVKILY